jgi:hypothetical protein
MKTALYRYLDHLGACDEALKWIEENNLRDTQAAWDTCPDARWLFWVTERHPGKTGWPTRQEVVLAACDCAEVSLYLIPACEDRPRIAIDTARRWAVGEADIEECRLTGLDAADVVFDATRFAGCIAARAVSLSRAASAAYRAAHHAVYAANYASDAANAVADAIVYSGGDKQEALADMADIVRKRLYIGKVGL